MSLLVNIQPMEPTTLGNDMTEKESRLRYTKERVDQKTIRRDYSYWRKEQNIPDRCDNPECHFHKMPLEWNGQQLRLVLDHISGVNSDNRPKNLRYLCPNCNAQQPTHGGGNKGRVEKASGGFAILGEGGKKSYTLVAEPGVYRLSQKPATLETTIVIADATTKEN